MTRMTSWSYYSGGSVTMEFPVGTYVVPTAQTLGRLVAHMLEVETEDNVVYWNTMDAWVPRPGSGNARPRGGPGGSQEAQEHPSHPSSSS